MDPLLQGACKWIRCCRCVSALPSSGRSPTAGGHARSCEAFKIGEGAVAQGGLVSGAQDHAGRLARLKCFLPTRCTQTPTVPWHEAEKAEFRHRCRKIVAAGFRELEKRCGHDSADSCGCRHPLARCRSSRLERSPSWG